MGLFEEIHKKFYESLNKKEKELFDSFNFQESYLRDLYKESLKLKNRSYKDVVFNEMNNITFNLKQGKLI